MDCNSKYVHLKNMHVFSEKQDGAYEGIVFHTEKMISFSSSIRFLTFVLMAVKGKKLNLHTKLVCCKWNSTLHCLFCIQGIFLHCFSSKLMQEKKSQSKFNISSIDSSISSFFRFDLQLTVLNVFEKIIAELVLYVLPVDS